MCRLTAEKPRCGSDGTLFVLAGAGGETDELLLVVDGLTGDPEVVVMAVAAEPGTADTIETMAAETVEMIRAEQPQGPYQLLGYSFGGLLALESARLLEDAGETVSFVGLVDALFDQRHWPTGLFLKATARRAALHGRNLAGQPPAQAVRELTERSVRLARRLRHRHQSADPGTPGLATVQDANLAVMAQWHPRTFHRPVTLFSATESTFGCDLADLWRPWLPELDVRRVHGNHLELTQTAAGAARLARTVSLALAGQGPRLGVLVASTFRWPGAARFAVDLNEVGCTVEAVAPRGSALHAVSAVQRSYRLGLADPLRSLRAAIEASDADLVVPFDDRTRQALVMLHSRSDPRTVSGVAMRQLLERSLGSPDNIASVYSRAVVMEIARESGVRCPPTAMVHSAGDISEWFERNPGPAVLKTDGSWGGRGVAILQTEADCQQAWCYLRRRTSYARALKRLVVERDPWALRARLVGLRPTVSIQSFVAGRPANAAVACFQGTPLATVQAEVVESDGRTGPSTVLRLIDNADMTYAVKSVVSNLGLSGFCGLDFILDDDGHAHLLELNPRATPTSHLIAADGTDLLTALRTAFGFERPPARTASYSNGLLALFPQELRRDSSSPNLRLAHHDVPTYAPDLVAHVLAGPRRRDGEWATNSVSNGVRAPSAVNINVHGIGPLPARQLEVDEDQVWVSVEQFERVLDAAIGRPEVTITFDDGNISDLEIGLPRLLERGLTARFYPCAGLLGEPGRLDASGVRELHAAGMVIGSHGWAHRDWRTLDWGARGTAAEVEQEMVLARRHLKQLTGSDVSEVAVPFGSYDRHVLRSLRRSGVTRVYTSDGGWARPGAWLQPRTSIRAGDGPEWLRRVMIEGPGPAERIRGKVARTAKSLRG